MRARPSLTAVAGFVLAALVHAACASANPFFNDDFDSAVLDTTLWNLEVGDGALTLANGTATLTCEGGTFPFLSMRDGVIPASQEFVVTIRMAYPTVTGLGIGVVSLADSELMQFNEVYLWQDSEATRGMVAAAGSTYPIRVFDSPHTEFHVYEWVYASGTYTFSIDGFVLATGPSTTPPNRLGFGHPHPVFFERVWSTLVLDYVTVSEPPARSDVERDTPPSGPFLRAVRPNPSRGTSRIEFSLPVELVADLCVFDVTGRAVRTFKSEIYQAGVHTWLWDGRDDEGHEAGAGAYWVRLAAGGVVSSKLFVLCR